MKFKFRLEKVLQQKKMELDMAKRDYASAQHALNQQLRYIQDLYEAISASHALVQSKTEQGGQYMNGMEQADEFVNLQKIKIDHEKQKARELMQVTEERHEALVEKMKDHKTIEKLKEKKREEFKIEMKKKENKAREDLTITRFGFKESS